MSEQQTDLEVSIVRDSKGLETVFKSLWEKVKKAAELIDHLKEENRSLQSKAVQLEEQVYSLKADLAQKEQTLAKLEEQQFQAPPQGNSSLSPEEKEVLKVRIKELIAKLNSHL